MDRDVERCAWRQHAITMAVLGISSFVFSQAASAAFDITSDNSQWRVAFSGANNDYFSDQQTGQGQSDVIGGISGGISYPSMYWFYDPGTSSTDGMMYFRARIAGKDSTSNWSFDNALMVGLDFANPSFGGMDLFLVCDAGAKDDVSVRWAGTSGNTSPSTTSIGNPITTTNAPTGSTSFSATNYNFQYANTVDLRPGVTYDLDNNSAIDGFVSFAVPFQDIVQAAQGSMGLSITNATAMKWGVVTSTQTNAVNEDVNGATLAEAKSTTPGIWTQVYVTENLPTGGISPIRSTWAVAAASAVTPNPVNLPNVRVGSAFGTRNLSLTNTAPNDGFSEKLDATIAASGGTATVGGSVSGLNPGAPSTNLSVGLSTPGTAGPKSGTATVTLASNGTGTSGAGTTVLGTQVITVTGSAYDYANPTGLPASVSFGNVRPSLTPMSRTVAVANTAITNAAYQDSLNATATPTNGKLSGSSFTGLAASSGGTITQNLTITANVSTAGSLADTVNVGLVSNANGVPGLSNQTLASKTVTTTGGVYRYAAGTLDTTTVALGNVHVGLAGSSVTSAIKITDTAAADGYSDNLSVNLSGMPSGVTYTAGSSVAPGAGSLQGGSLTVDTSAPRQINSTLGASLVSNPTVAGLDSGHQVGTGSVLVTANIYSGLSTWTSGTGGNWASFGNWEVVGGAPGTDAGYTTTDTATFGGIVGSNATAIAVAVNAPVSVKSVTFNNAAAAYTVAGSGPLSFAGNSASLTDSAGSHTINAPVVLNTNLAVAVNGSGDVLSVNSLSGGNRTLTKSGAGTLAITGNSSGLTGGATVNAGALDIGGLFGGSVAVNAGGTLLGSGEISGTVTLNSGAMISAGSANQVGELSITGSGTTLFAGGSSFSWDVLGMTGAAGSQDTLAGSGFDVLSITGPLSITATPSNPMVISLNSLSAQGTDGALSGWDKSKEYQWTIATASGGISDFDASAFRVDGASFFAANGGQDTGYFFVSQSPTSLTLHYAVPEPALVLTLSGTVMSALALRPMRRRRSQEV